MSQKDFDKPESQDASGDFREPDELTNAKVRDLAEDIVASGIVTPLSNGTCRLLGGHRRLRALRRLRNRDGGQA
jgi:ParB-like chromosome segregation protein Spo0J